MADDRAQLGLLMDRFLSAVSFDETGRPAYRQLHDLFTAEGRLIRSGPGAPEIWTVEDFIRSRQQAVDAGLLTFFQEVEVGEVTEIFGSVAHRFSTYLKTGMLNGAGLDARGAISTQFVHTHEGWRISSMAVGRRAVRPAASGSLRTAAADDGQHSEARGARHLPGQRRRGGGDVAAAR